MNERNDVFRVKDHLQVHNDSIGVQNNELGPHEDEDVHGEDGVDIGTQSELVKSKRGQPRRRVFRLHEDMTVYRYFGV